MKRVGFSSGAIAYGDFNGALETLAGKNVSCLELSALRVSELRPLIDAIPLLDLASYSYVSFHAPSSFSKEDELWVADLLFREVPENWPIVIHPDTIHDYQVWIRFGSRLAIENMDRRKPIGRTAKELAVIFRELPEAALCFDIGHARQCDPTMTEAFLILSQFQDKLVQVHVSEVNSSSQHDPISYGAKIAFQQIAAMIPNNVPLIIESRVSSDQMASEIQIASEALTARTVEHSELAELVA